jgi:NAD(P)-dependent dehydrogenase (short-subunit alcohol dehydrogenase family)
MSTENSVAIVTAAGQGIGAACARGLAERGYRVVLMSRSADAETIARELGGTGIRGSVTSQEDLGRLVELALQSYGRIDAIVNNTGRDPESLEVSGPPYDPDLDRSLTAITDEAWLHGFDLYFLNVVRMARVVTPHFQRQGGGAIVNISTFAALEPRLIFPVSGAMRMALAAYAKLYADRYGRDGIRMNNVLPGFVDNWPLTEANRRTIPLGRATKMSEVVATVAFLISPEGAAITGQNMLVDGGVNRAL